MKEISTRSFLIITIFVAIISSTVFAALNSSIKSEALIDDAVSACAHTYNNSSATCTQAKKCTKCGYVAVKALGHTYNVAATCTKAKKCTRCGDVAVEALGHTYNITFPTCTEAKKCTRCGHVEAEALGHDYKYKSSITSHWRECIRCSNKLIAESHLYQSGINCEENKMCIICGCVGGASEHDYNISSPTCTEAKKCKKCGYKEDEMLGHKYGDFIKTDPNTHWKECSNCDAVEFVGVHQFNQNGKCFVCGYGCEHKFEDGVCINCDYKCDHPVSERYKTADYVNKNSHKLKTICEICDKEISNENTSHSFNKNGNGICEKCLFQCPHEEWDLGMCTRCRYYCLHDGRQEYLYDGDEPTPIYHYVYTECSICGDSNKTKATSEPHNFEKDGKCSKCGYECKHSFNGNGNAICKICGYYCSHEWMGDTCDYCGAQCNHNGKKEDLYYKDLETSTDHYRCTKCSICKSFDVTKGTSEPHNFRDDEFCIDCGYECNHSKKYKTADYVNKNSHKLKTICEICDKEISNENESHSFNNKNGICGKCLFQCPHEEWDLGMCTRCRYYCLHDGRQEYLYDGDEPTPIYHYVYTECSICGDSNKTKATSEPHNFEKDRKCSKCGYECKHSFNENGICKICGYACEHQFKSKVKYKNETTHTVTQKCAVCGYKKTDERNHENLELVRPIIAGNEKHRLLMKCSECRSFSIEGEHIKNAQGKCTLCGFNLINSDEVIKATKLNISLSSKKLKVGEIIDLQDSLSVSPEGAKTNLEWNASNDNVTLKANGRLTANKAGSTTIKVTDTISGKTASVTIKIEKDKSTSSTETKNTTFNDVESDSWYNEVVQKATKENIFNGVTENEFAPNDYITRGMFVTALARVDKIDVAGYANLFSDVDDEIYYADSIKWASVYGIVNGIGDGKFAPDELMTREEMAVMIHNYIDSQYKNVYIFNMSDEENVSQFNDDDEISSWASVAVNELADMGIINGNENGNFAPKDNVTRAEAAAVLVRLSEKTKVN